VVIPTFDPMLATLDGAWPKDPIIEPKWDGVRSMITLRADGSAMIRSRNGKDVTGAYPELHVRPPSMAGRDGVFDGEVIAVDDSGRCSFQLLQRRMNVNNPTAATRRATPVYFVVFDVMWLDGAPTTSIPLAARRALLEELIPTTSGAWQLTNRFAGPVTDELLELARQAGLEGLILKGEGPYRAGTRTKDWVKVKFRRSRLVVIGGRATDSSSLAIGVFHEGQLRYVGQVGIAMSRTRADELDKFLLRIRQPASPFADLAQGATVAFVEPLIVAEVSYLEVTHAGTLRQPILDAIRPDVRADTVIADAELAVILSNRTGPVAMRASQRL
jgi:bifunctional non-homologous end joining protein LigD